MSFLTASIVSTWKSGISRMAPSMRSTFQPGRESPRGFTAALNDCTRPSMLTKVPAVSVKGVIGRTTCAASVAALRYAESATVNSARAIAATAAGPMSSSGSTPAMR